MKIFISGGCKNGKSYYAMRIASLLNPGKPRYYIATMVPSDKEDDERIIRHRAEREGYDFITIELPRGIDNLPEHCNPDGVYLLDSVTALLANEMFVGNEYFENAYEKVCADLISLIKKTRNIVVVSDYIYSDANLYDYKTENYRKGLGVTDRAVVSACDAALEITFGGIIIHKDTKGFFLKYDRVI